MEEPAGSIGYNCNLSLAVDCTLSLGSTSARIAPDHDLSWSLAVRSSRTCEPSEPAMSSWPGSFDAAVSPDYYSQQVEGREVWPSDKSVKTSSKALFSMIKSSQSYGHGRSSRHQPGWLTSYMPSSTDVVKEAGSERVCAHCGTSKTPLWRNGPNRPKSLCNACGIRFKKAGRRSGDLPPSPSPMKASKALRKTTEQLPATRKPRSRAGSESVSCMTWQAPKSTASSTSQQQDHLQLLGSSSYSSDEAEEGAVLLMALSCGMVNA